jgi:hypothetical protein
VRLTCEYDGAADGQDEETQTDNLKHRAGQNRL